MERAEERAEQSRQNALASGPTQKPWADTMDAISVYSNGSAPPLRALGRLQGRGDGFIPGVLGGVGGPNQAEANIFGGCPYAIDGSVVVFEARLLRHSESCAAQIQGSLERPHQGGIARPPFGAN